MSLERKVYETIILKRLTDTQTMLAEAMKLLLECKPFIEEHEDDFTDTAPDIRALIKEYVKIHPPEEHAPFYEGCQNINCQQCIHYIKFLSVPSMQDICWNKGCYFANE